MGTKQRPKLTPVGVWHWTRLIYRSILFLLLVYAYIKFRFINHKPFIMGIEKMPAIIIFVWTVYVIEMIFRFFPSRIESPGCQKQFARNYIKTGETDVIVHDNNATMLVALIWVVFNGIFGALHMVGILNDDFMLLLCSLFSVCDIICILFFCPFQTWFFKNRCCVTCRIYNWDFAMMFTPLFFVPAPYTCTLLAMSGLLLIRWEITFMRHPERFSDNTNDFITCKNCTEKLCRHKRQLKGLWQKIEVSAKKKLQKLLK